MMQALRRINFKSSVTPLTNLLTYLLTYLITYLLTYLLLQIQLQTEIASYALDLKFKGVRRRIRLRQTWGLSIDEEFSKSGKSGKEVKVLFAK